MAARQSPVHRHGNTRSVYTAAAGYFRRGVSLDEEAVLRSPHAVQISGGNRGTPLVAIRRDAPDFNDLFIRKGLTIPPDELLAKPYDGDLEIPLRPRHDFPAHNQLPASDLVKAIHYYASAKVAAGPDDLTAKATRMTQSMDETALLCMGKLIEEWVDDLVDSEGARAWARIPAKEKNGAVNWKGLGGEYGEDGDASVLSSDWSLSGGEISQEEASDASESLNED